jgi:hypothetical protein
MRSVLKCVAMGAAMSVAITAAVPAGAEAQSVRSGPSSEPRVLYAISFRPGPGWQAGRPFVEQKGFKAHFAYVKRLFGEGRVFAAGGLGADHGLILLYARDQAEADAVVAADPTVQAGTFLGEARRFTPAFVADGPLTLTKEQKEQEDTSPAADVPASGRTSRAASGRTEP